MIACYRNLIQLIFHLNMNPIPGGSAIQHTGVDKDRLSLRVMPCATLKRHLVRT